ncbi:hypothetical protein GSI_12643 [Ganoderma sinense ZZ0214-1]|uniref:BTB domain-containing protein n=1 Tax=Ganoderma sinense ZZ0214-1 TaxID=1077348 RepID=A0A2G8RTB1_9APHY|nr:hypothetical protein GSI_12643 [Ganoderma sinense ZZ0214-1]
MPGTILQENLTAPGITTASHPFDKPNADIILRTSDRVDFHVHSQILIVASPFFEGMLNVPQPPPDQQQLKSGRPIIELSETSKALDPLLRICYPINKPKNRSLEEVELSLAAAMKFDMELPTTVLMEDLESFASSRPLEVWGIACRLRLESVANFVAKSMTSAHFSDFTVLGDTGMDGISAANYFRLSEYFRLGRKTPEAFKFLSPASVPKLSPVTGTASMAIIPSRPLADAPAPDIICRSADGIDFPAHRTVISLASVTLMPKASQVTESPPPEEGSSSELVPPVVQFEEGGIVLHALLQLSYRSPADVTFPTDLMDLTAVLVATEKYDLRSAQPAVWSFWQEIASQNPLRAYCCAIRVGHMVGAKEAARCALNHIIKGVYVEELECTPALAYHRILTYYEKCRTASKQELARIINSLKGPVKTAAPAPIPPPPDGDRTRRRLEGGVPAGKLNLKTKTWSLGNPVYDGPWLLRHLRSLSCQVDERPGSAMPELADLFVEATKAWSDGKVPRMWCEGCQVLAEEILEVNKGLQQLPGSLSKVSRFPSYMLLGATYCSEIKSGAVR